MEFRAKTGTTYGETRGKSYSFSDGIPAIPAIPEYKHTADVTPLEFDKVSNGDTAYAELDLSAYQTNNAAALESFIDLMVGKSIYDGGGNGYIGFYDSSSAPAFTSMPSITGIIDLDDLRNIVLDSGTNIADAFADLVMSRTSRVSTIYNTPGNSSSGVNRLHFEAARAGSAYNGTKISACEYNLRHYNLDYGSWFAKNGSSIGNVPEYLNGKGFRAYCATDAQEWFNFIFVDPSSNSPERPEKNDDDDSEVSIQNIEIDVSNVTDASSLVQAIYEQAKPVLDDRDHYMRLAADFDKGILTLYDERPHSNYQLANEINASGKAFYPNYQKGMGHYYDGGAKIADGVMDTQIYFEKNLYVRNLRIHDTTKSSMYVNVQIPQMTLDHIFWPLPQYDKQNIQDYDVRSKQNRDDLLGDPKADPPIKGILDQGLEYMLEANTLVGAQIARLEHTELNLGRTLENTQAAESTIRDADMAKAMTEYTKQNVLMQASQSMLAQANQNGSSILSLLQ